MRSRTSLSRTHRFLVAGLVLGGCGPETLNAPAGGKDSPPPVSQDETQVTEIREDFDHRQQIAQIDRARVNVNVGVLTLDVEPVPALTGTGEVTLSQEVETNGRIEAKDIHVTAGATVLASDGIELRASGSVHIEGTLRAGGGGVTIVAARDVVIAGRIESRGPVRIQTSRILSETRVLGTIVVRATADDEGRPPPIEFLGRGSVWIEGVVETWSEVEKVGGDITVRVYGDATMTGTRATVRAISEVGGTPGAIRLRSESSVRILLGAQVGDPEALDDHLGNVPNRYSGHLELEAPEIEVGTGAWLVGGRARNQGANLDLTASGALLVGPGAKLRSGVGSTQGGRISLQGSRVKLGSGAQLTVGEGFDRVGSLEILAAQEMEIEAGVVATGASAVCADGGDIRIQVAGPLVATPDVSFRAGPGGTGYGTIQCATAQAGGSVSVEAHSIEGLDPARVIQGRGNPDGRVNLRTSDSVSVLLPTLSLRTEGSILSVILDRGEDLVGRTPSTANITADIPTGTRVRVELSGSTDRDGDFSNFVNAREGSELSPLAAARYFRFQVRLWGRLYDAPVVDHLEIKLR